MCQFFSCIVTRDKRVFFTEHDSHEVIVQRGNFRDDDFLLRHWVRVEVKPRGKDKWGPVQIDDYTTPTWWFDEPHIFEDLVLKIANRVRPASEEYNRIIAPALENYTREQCAAQRDLDIAHRLDPLKEWQKCYKEYFQRKAEITEVYAAMERSVREKYVAAIAHIPGYLRLGS